MEKFSKWADRSSRVNPFIPIPPRPPKSVIMRVPVFLIGLLLALVRMPLALFFLGTATIGGVSSRYLPVVMAVWAAERAMNGLASDRVWGTRFLIAIPLLLLAQFEVSIFRVFLVRIPLRLAMFIMGVKVEEKHADVRRLGLRPTGADPPVGRPGSGVRRGHIVVRNSCSFLEVLYLQSRVTPQFTTIAAGGESSPANLRRVRFFSAVLRSFRPPARTLIREQTLCDIVANPRGRTRSIVVAPEAARTNGAGILLFSRVFDSLMQPPSVGDSGIVSPPVVHLVTFSYNRRENLGGGRGRRGGYTPAQPVGSAARQLYWLCSQMSRSTMEVSWLGSDDVPKFPPRGGIVRKFTAGPGIQTPIAWTEEIRSLMAAMLNRPKLCLGSRDFASFHEYYELLRRGHKSAAADVADQVTKT